MVKVNSKSQNGRSMVEMLGLLAIVGTLSVGGVYGYGVAMKKHKANELLHQASMLATTISAKIQSKGELPTTIENFGDAKYGTFNPPSEANAEQFTMKITDMDSAVCAQVAKMSGGMVRQAVCDDTTLTLTYNNNLSSDKVAADYNGKQDECVASGRKYCDNDTCIPATEECPVTGPTCPTGTSTEGAGGYATTLADNSMCYCETAGTVYKAGTCESKGDDNTCSSYADCDKGEYCQFPPTTCQTDPTSGVCQSVSGCGLYDIDISDGKKYTGSNHSGSCSPNWWTAKDVCASLNMRMPSLSEVGCQAMMHSFCPTDGTVYGALKSKGLKRAFWTTDMDSSYWAWHVGLDYADYINLYDCRSNIDFLCVR